MQVPSGECMYTVLYGKGASYQLSVELNDYLCVVCVKDNPLEGRVRNTSSGKLYLKTVSASNSLYRF